jgi:putative ABC transport system permease protein
MTPLYRVLLRAYPRWFRERYETELLAAFAAERDRLRHRGFFGTLRFSLFIATDLFGSALRLRLDGTRPCASDHARRRRNQMDTWLQDLRDACRLLVRRPGFTFVAVMSLALGIGGNTIIFAFVDGWVLHPFAHHEPDRIVAIGVTFPRMSAEERFVEVLSAAEYADIRESRTMSDFAVFDLGNRNISGGDRPERVFTCLAQTDLFAPFGLRPALGRGFNDAELKPGGPDVAVLSHRLWQGRFGGDPNIVGRSIRVNGAPTTVVGVMPREVLILGADLWLPAAVDPLAEPRNARQLSMIGRLAPGATLEQANAELSTIANNVSAAHAARFEEYQGWRLSATPWASALMRDLRVGAFTLLGAVALVLLIACANLSNLMLARASVRQREIAIRLALGAGTSRIARHLFTEVAVLAVLGAATALLVAQAGLRFLAGIVPAQVDTLGVTASLNWRVLAWTALFTFGSTLLIALLPVFQSARTDPHDAMKADGRGTTTGGSPQRIRHSLVVAEIALSVLLLCAAALFVRSFVNVRLVDPGFDTTKMLTMRITLPLEKYRGEGINNFFQQVVDRLGQAPGVRAASVATQFPPRTPFSTAFHLEGAASGTAMTMTTITMAGEELFRTLGVPVVAGRAFDERDRGNAPLVAVVNQAFASQFVPGGSPIGKRLTTGPSDRRSAPMEIVGVVANTRNRGVRNQPAPEIFVPMHQQGSRVAGAAPADDARRIDYNNQMFLLVRTDSDAGGMLPTVREAITAVDPDQPIYAIQTMEDAFAEDMFRHRLSMILFGLFAAVALSLAGIGIYGVMSYAVSARTQEIGVRMAVGAERRDVVWLVLRQVARLTAIGLAIGIAGVIAGGRVLRRLLFEVQPSDPIALIAAVVVLGAVAFAAGWFPAWRASRVDPMVALRYE